MTEAGPIELWQWSKFSSTVCDYRRRSLANVIPLPMSGFPQTVATA
jgi:hypothetical protein